MTKRKRVITKLKPEPRTPSLPDFRGMLHRIYGSKTLKVTGSRLLRKERDEGY